MSEFPIPVERLDAYAARVLVCQECERERQATSEEIGLNEGLPPCKHCGGWMDWKYAEADRCPGCGQLGWWDTPHGCCSRVCQLQAEYADSLEAA